MTKVYRMLNKVTYWLAWKLAGKRIWNKAVMWSAGHIYLYSRLPKTPMISLPDGITVTDEPVVLASGTTIDGAGHILAQPLNVSWRPTITVLAGAGGVKVLNTIILGSTAVSIEGQGLSSKIVMEDERDKSPNRGDSPEGSEP